MIQISLCIFTVCSESSLGAYVFLWRNKKKNIPELSLKKIIFIKPSVSVFCFKSFYNILFLMMPIGTKKALMQIANNTGPDQPVHLCSLIRAFVALLQSQRIL